MKNPEILDLYSEYLIASFNLTTATGLAELVEELSHDQISRFLNQRYFTPSDYWKCVKPLIRRCERADGIIKIDDTIEEKPHSQQNEINCYHWDHSKDRHVKGIQIINFLYESSLISTSISEVVEEKRTKIAAHISIPLAYEVIRKTEQFYDKKSGKVKRRSKQSKNALVRERLRILTFMNRVKFRYVMWDTWYSSNDNFKFVHHELSKYFITAIKSNRLVARSKQDQLDGKFCKIEELDLQTERAMRVWIKGLDFPVLLTKQVFTNKDGSSGKLYVVTNDLNLTYQAINDAYDKRWEVEVLHKGLKQNVGLEKSPTKIVRTQLNHIFAAMVAWTKLELLRIKAHSNHFAIKKMLYVKAVEAAFEELQRLKKQQFTIPLLE